MKKINLLLLLLPLTSISFAQEVRKVKDTRMSRINQTKLTEATRTTFDANAMVPEKTNITVVDGSGRTVRRYSGGSRMQGQGILDCVKTKCPNTFDTTVVCWECQRREMK